MPVMTVSFVVRRHGVAPNQLFTWRLRVAQGGADALLLMHFSFATRLVRSAIRSMAQLNLNLLWPPRAQLALKARLIRAGSTSSPLCRRPRSAPARGMARCLSQPSPHVQDGTDFIVSAF